MVRLGDVIVDSAQFNSFVSMNPIINPSINGIKAPLAGVRLHSVWRQPGQEARRLPWL